jgi:hypothetical protein
MIHVLTYVLAGAPMHTIENTLLANGIAATLHKGRGIWRDPDTNINYHEDNVTVMIVTHYIGHTDAIIAGILRDYNQICALRIVDGEAMFLNMNGTTSPIDPTGDSLA